MDNGSKFISKQCEPAYEHGVEKGRADEKKAALKVIRCLKEWLQKMVCVGCPKNCDNCAVGEALTKADTYEEGK